MRVALITEGTYPHQHGGVSVWCDQVVRGLWEHQFEIAAIVATGNEVPVWTLPENAAVLTPVPLWSSAPAVRASRSVRRTMAPVLERFLATLADGHTTEEFLASLREVYEAAQDGQLRQGLASPEAVALVLEHMARESAAGWSTHVSAPTVADAVEALVLIEHFLRPLELPPLEVDLTHAVSNGLAALPAIATKWARGTPFLLTEHGLYLRERLLAHRPGTHSQSVRTLLLAFFKRLIEASYLTADLITPGSHYCRLWELASGAESSRIRPVHNGIEPTDFDEGPEEPDEPVLVYVGRVDPLKDVETMLRAFALVRQSVPGARLRMFGPPPVVLPYARRCEELVDELGLRGAAVFEGRIDSVADAYRAGQVVLLTSISEGFPYAVLEAMACGRPVVATDVGGVGEAVGPAGVVVPPRDPEAVARAAVDLLEDGPLRRSLGREARERVTDRFTVASCIESFRELYRDMIFPSDALAPVLPLHPLRPLTVLAGPEDVTSAPDVALDQALLLGTADEEVAS